MDKVKLRENALELILKRIDFLSDNLNFNLEEQKKIQIDGVEVSKINVQDELNFLRSLIENDNTDVSKIVPVPVSESEYLDQCKNIEKKEEEI